MTRHVYGRVRLTLEAWHLLQDGLVPKLRLEGVRKAYDQSRDVRLRVRIEIGQLARLECEIAARVDEPAPERLASHQRS